VYELQGKETIYYLLCVFSLPGVNKRNEIVSMFEMLVFPDVCMAELHILWVCKLVGGT